MPTTMHLDFTDAWLHYRFGQLRRTIDLSERLLQQEASELVTWVEAEASKLPQEERQEFYASISDEHYELREVVPNVLRRALFIVCYTEIEAYLNTLCRLPRNSKGPGVSLDDLVGRGIERAKRYLAKVLRVDFPSKSPDWQELTNYNKLRNVLAHTEGRLSAAQRSKHIGCYVAKHQYLDLDSLGYIVIHKGFCEEVIDTALRFFKQLPADLRRRAPGGG